MQGIKLLFVGKTDKQEIKTLIKEYEKRISRFSNIEVEEIPDVKKGKNMSEELLKKREGEKIQAALGAQDDVILMDEKGIQPTSRELAKILEQKQLTVDKKLVIVIGGPYGFSEEVYQRYKQRLSLSRLTLSHQMVRLFLIEQIYRAFTIIHKHPYHHD